jgi:hypothetical protein
MIISVIIPFCPVLLLSNGNLPRAWSSPLNLKTALAVIAAADFAATFKLKM